MSDRYVTAKIHEALKATDHDIHDAQKLIITWAVRDQPLLLGLAKPHLKALALARIDDVNRRAGELGVTSDEEVESMILTHSEGEKRSPVKVPPPKPSKRQSTIMKIIAGAFGRK